MKIRPVGAEMFHADTDGRTDRHDKSNDRFWQFCKRALNTALILHYTGRFTLKI
jgi:hypothetical protein